VTDANVSKHRLELQSLRGLAAFLVMIHHALRTLDSHSLAWNISENVLNAHGAVVVFFVLSGYVLTKSIVGRGFDFNSVSKFYVRRVFRIYPALWAAIAVGVFYMLTVKLLSAPQMSPWMAKYYDSSGLNLTTIAASIAGLDAHLLPTAWTITIEIVASVVLPLFVWVLCSARIAAISLLVVMTVVSFSFGVNARQVPLYMVDFVLGAMLATSPWLQGIRIGTMGAAISAIVLMFFRRLWNWDYHDPLPSFVEALASVVLISAITQHRVQWLKNQTLVKIGDWSYSIYLLHLPIALIATRIMCHLAGDTHSDLLSFAIMVLTVGVTLPLSALAYRYIEAPGIALGVRVFQALEGRIFPRMQKAAG
jgi:peptidoglycan/LPS O-acetylase OafA/YrhL